MEREMAERWRRWRLGMVPIASPRGLAGLLLFLLSVALVFAFPVLILAKFLETGRAAEGDQELTQAGLVLNLAYNAVAFLAVPVAALAVVRPGVPGAVIARLRMQVEARTVAHVLIGAASAVAALILLGIVVLMLQRYADLAPEESELVPQIQALLTWPLVILISVTAAVTEEVYFRGLLQPRIGLIASSLLFGFIHVGYGTTMQLVVPFVLGVFFGLLQRWTGSLWTPIAAHFTFDFIQLSALLIERPN